MDEKFQEKLKERDGFVNKYMTAGHKEQWGALWGVRSRMRDAYWFGGSEDKEYIRFLQTSYQEVRDHRFAWLTSTFTAGTIAGMLALWGLVPDQKPAPHPVATYVVEQRCGIAVPERIVRVNGIEQLLEVDGKPIAEYGRYLSPSYCTK